MINEISFALVANPLAVRMGLVSSVLFLLPLRLGPSIIASTKASSSPIERHARLVPAAEDEATVVQNSSKPETLAASHYNRGIVAYANGRFTEAAREWEIAITLDSGNDKVRHALRRVRRELSEIQG